ncbi:MAG TPA: hypothetical protein VMW63_01770 [Methanoregulaceae archaeon]|nr:hypothetical protein [Methanoregulaceae archaeon]
MEIVGPEESERESGFRRRTEEDERMVHFDARMVVCSPPGRYVVNLPPHGKTRYKLYFDALADGESHIPQYRLELVTLHCHDAQEYADRVYIKVNGTTVWGPRRMRTGNTLLLDDAGILSIPNLTTVQLWEDDERHRDDFFGELMLRIGDDSDFIHNQHFTFSRDKGISGDASYTLTYRIRESH